MLAFRSLSAIEEMLSDATIWYSDGYKATIAHRRIFVAASQLAISTDGKACIER
jgi:hypothetical protein